jgi:phosphatidylinositol glycan class W
MSLLLLKDPKCLSSPLLPKIVNSVQKTVPMLLLGVARVIVVKGSEYPVSDEIPAGTQS